MNGYIDLIYQTLAVIFPVFLYEAYLIRKREGDSLKSSSLDKGRLPLHLFLILILSIFFVAAFKIANIGTIYDIGKYRGIIRKNEINLIPFKDLFSGEKQDLMWIIKQDILNIIFFIPFGFLIPLIFKRKRNLGSVLLLSLLLSFLIEFCQLFNFRVSDVSDLITNTIGGGAGFVLWALLRYRIRPVNKKAIELKRKEAMSLILIAAFSYFILYNPNLSLSVKADEAETKDIVLSEEKKKEIEVKTEETEYEDELSFVLSHEEYYPEGKVKSAMNNPELIHFMYDFAKGNTASEEENALTADETNGDMPFLFQWDRRWGFYDYGDSVIGFSGCGPTALSMVIAYYNGEGSPTPKDLSDYAMIQGYYLKGTGTKWSFMTDAPAAYKIKARQITGNIEEAYKEAKKNNPVILSVGKGHFTNEGHFIVLSGVSEDGRVIVHDPNSLLNSTTLYSFDEIKEEIRAAWVYEK